jgi:hypothetical protein
MLKYGLWAGFIIGTIVAIFVTGNLLHIPLGMVLGTGLAEIYGYAEDNRIQQEHRVL